MSKASKKFDNKRAKEFIDAFPECSIESKDDTLTERCKFNFSYFDVQDAGQAIGDWDHTELASLLEKLKEFSQKSLAYWRTQGGGRFVVYGKFPAANSDFKHPKHVPHQAQWARFRLESTVRLVGFVLPNDVHGAQHVRTKERFDSNTFYVVFFDKHHLFYKVKAK